jgi:hypothetical protein
MAAAELFIGIDVARDSLEIATRPTGERWQVGNDARRTSSGRGRRHVRWHPLIGC